MLALFDQVEDRLPSPYISHPPEHFSPLICSPARLRSMGVGVVPQGMIVVCDLRQGVPSGTDRKVLEPQIGWSFTSPAGYKGR